MNVKEDVRMAKNEKSGEEVASIAARLLKHPGDAKKKEIKALAASVLTQAPDQPKPPKENPPKSPKKDEPKPPRTAPPKASRRKS
jgi:carnitine O-acetyltransferase